MTVKTAFAQLRGSSTANTRKLTVTTPLESPPANTDAAREANEHGAALAHQGRFREAAAAFDGAFDFEPENAEAPVTSVSCFAGSTISTVQLPVLGSDSPSVRIHRSALQPRKRLVSA